MTKVDSRTAIWPTKLTNVKLAQQNLLKFKVLLGHIELQIANSVSAFWRRRVSNFKILFSSGQIKYKINWGNLIVGCLLLLILWQFSFRTSLHFFFAFKLKVYVVCQIYFWGLITSSKITSSKALITSLKVEKWGFITSSKVLITSSTVKKLVLLG